MQNKLVLDIKTGFSVESQLGTYTQKEERSVEMIAVLEKKIESLIELLRTFKEENIALKNQNVQLESKAKQLEEQIIRLEHSLLHENNQFEQKLTVTEKAVSELLKSIDELIENER